MQRSNLAAPTSQSFSNAYEIGSRRNTRRSIAKLLRRSRPESGRPGSVRRAQRTVRRSSVGDLHGRHVARGVVALPIHDSYIVPRVSKNCAKTRLPGCGCSPDRTRLSLQFVKMQGDFRKMQGRARRRATKNARISIVWMDSPYSGSREAIIL